MFHTQWTCQYTNPRFHDLTSMKIRINLLGPKKAKKSLEPLKINQNLTYA